MESEDLRVRLAELISDVIGGGTPARGVSTYWGGDLPWASVKDLSDALTDLEDTQESITPSGLASSASKLVEPGTVLVATRMAVGRAAVARQRLAINQDLKGLLPDPKRTTSRFLLHQLKNIQPLLERQAIGSTVLGLSVSALLGARIFAPPLAEQRRIAEILDTLDEAIRKTEQFIAKLKQVKQGLLHDLLTRGIDENGELRDPERHPEQFKDSLLGLIPRAWQETSLEDVLAGIDAGWSPACIERPPALGDWGILKVSAVTSGEFRPHESKTLPPHLTPHPELQVEEGDVVLARANGVTELVGVTAEVVAPPPHLMLSDKLLRIRPFPERLLPGFLALLMMSVSIRRQIAAALSGSSGQKNISQGFIRKLKVVLPAPVEQEATVMATRGADLRIRAEYDNVRKLRLLKQGLMEDLLTGHVRVTALLNESAP